MADQEPQENQETSTYSVYITGGATRYGQEVIRQLVADGHSVAAFAATSAQANILRECGALPVYGDETDLTGIRHNLKLVEADTIIHLKPQLLNIPPLVRKDWDTLAIQMHAENDALLGAAAQLDSTPFIVLASYAFLYADTNGETVDETAPARTGEAAQLFAAALDAERHVLEVGGCVLRVGYLYGDSDTDPLHDLAAQMRRGLPMRSGEPDHMANWLRDRDLPAAVVAAAEQQPANRIYNLVGNTPVSLYHFLEMFSEQTGLRIPQKMPGFMARNVYGPAHLALLDSDVALSNERAKDELAWSPQYADVETSLDDIMLTWRATQTAV